MSQIVLAGAKRAVLSVKSHWGIKLVCVLVGQFKLQAPGFI